MKKGLFTLGIILAILVSLFYLGKATGMLVMYNCPSGANEPTLKVGSRFFTSILKKPEKLDLIVYIRKDQMNSMANELVVHRLCGIPGDKIEIKEGILYVNDKNADEGLNLYNEYLIKLPLEMQKIRSLALENDNAFSTGFRISADAKDSLVVNLSTQYLKEKNIQGKLFIFDIASALDAVKKQWRQDWSMDNFGPVTVPEDSFFVLGDNRHNSSDSRFIGFVAKTHYKGTVLGKR